MTRYKNKSTGAIIDAHYYPATGDFPAGLEAVVGIFAGIPRIKINGRAMRREHYSFFDADGKFHHAKKAEFEAEWEQL